MSEENPTYRATLFRPVEAWRDAVLVCGDLTVPFRLGTENGIVKLCQMMRYSDMPDGDLFVREIGVPAQHALTRYRPSIFDTSKLDVITQPIVSETVVSTPQVVDGITIGMYNALTALKTNPEAWSGLHGRTKGALTKNKMVTNVTETSATVAKNGEQAIETFAAALPQAA